MAYTTEYTISITNLEGNTLVYDLEEESGAGASAAMDLTENSYDLDYFFSDRNSTNIGLGVLHQAITLEFFGDDEINDIKAAPQNWRLTITLDGTEIFVGFPDVRSINEYALESFADTYQCTFVNVFSQLKKRLSITEIASSGNGDHYTDQIYIPDLLGEFVMENYCNLSSDVIIAHDWQSENTITSVGVRRADPHMIYFNVDPGRVAPQTVADLIKFIAVGFSARIGYSYQEGKLCIFEHIKGADGSSISGYNTVKNAGTGFRTTSADTITLQSIATDGSDFITDGRDVNSDNPVFPVAVNSIDGNHNIITSNYTSNSPFLDDLITLETIFKDDALCAADQDGITSLGVGGAFVTLGQLDNVDPTSTATLYDMNQAMSKRIGVDYLFTEGLQGFRVPINKNIDPMIPITYGSTVFISPEGTINLFEETTDCLLIEIQDNA